MEYDEIRLKSLQFFFFCKKSTFQYYLGHSSNFKKSVVSDLKKNLKKIISKFYIYNITHIY